MSVKTETPHMRDVHAHDPYATAIGLLDQAFMLAYAHVRKNARRIAHLTVALVPLMGLLVGSCKTSQLPWSYGSNQGSQQFRIALFPDQVNFTGKNYYPAEGYVSRARTFVESSPQTLKMLTSQEIGYLFGKPTLRRKDADAQIWQYKTDRCVVDFYFYGKNQLSHIDVRLKADLAIDSPIRSTPVSDRQEKKCLRAVAQDFSSVRA